MGTKKKYTDRVTRDLDGTYRWKCPVQLESDPQGYRLGLIVCVVVCLLSILLCAFIGMDFMISVLPVIIGSVAAAILFFYLTSKAASLSSQKYEMNGQYIQKVIDAKKTVSFDYHRIREIVVHPLYLELYDDTQSSRIYVPKEDFYFVKDYITGQTMGRAAIRYEGDVL